MIPAAATLATLAREAAEDVFDYLTADCSEPMRLERKATMPKYTTEPVPTMPLPHVPAPDTRGDWRLVAWLPVVFAVAALRWARWHVAGWLYRAGDAVNPAPPLTEAAQASMAGRIMRAVEAEAARDRGGAT